LSSKNRDHRYVRKVDCSKHSILVKIHFNKTRALLAGTYKAGRPHGWSARSIDFPTLTANIFQRTQTELTFATRQTVHAINQSILWDAYDKDADSKWSRECNVNLTRDVRICSIFKLWTCSIFKLWMCLSFLNLDLTFLYSNIINPAAK
jgi:hypothetical protein